jgi:hypothetical protein
MSWQYVKQELIRDTILCGLGGAAVGAAAYKLGYDQNTLLNAMQYGAAVGASANLAGEAIGFAFPYIGKAIGWISGLREKEDYETFIEEPASLEPLE